MSMGLPGLHGYTYSYKKAQGARETNRLLSIRLETSLSCNLKCIYCCNKSGKALEDELPYLKLTNIIDEAYELGAESIVVIGGGEPTIYPHFRELITYIFEKNLVPVIFTNTTTMTDELASFLFLHNVTVITKMDSLLAQRQDELAGVPGTFERIQKGLKALKKAGYFDARRDGMLKMGASFVVNKTNSGEIPDIWRFCRENTIYPNLEMMIPNGEAEEMQDDLLSAREWRELKEGLHSIDKNEFEITWPQHITFCNGCRQMLYNLYITVKGNVRPCSSVHLERYGISLNVNTMALRDILKTELFRKIRHIEKHVTGKCGACVHNPSCYGCRAMAFAYGYKSGLDLNSALASEDPSCDYFAQKNNDEDRIEIDCI